VAKLGGVLAGVSFFGTMIAEARDAERTGKQTEAVLRSTGGAANLTAKQIGELAGKLSEKTAVDDEVIQHGENVLLTFKNIRDEAGKGNDIFSQTTAVALDMSAALSESGDASDGLQSNMTRLGKALNDPIAGIGALTKVGVSFTEQQKEQIKALVEQGDTLAAQKIILSELQTEFGGMAEASADSIGKAQVSWGNFAEEVGGKVMPAVNAVSNWALTTGIPALGQVAGVAADVVTPAFQGVVSVGGQLVDMWQALPGPIQAGAIAMVAWSLAGDRVTGFLGKSTGPLKSFSDELRLQQGLASLAGQDVGKFGASIAVLERNVPAVARMGEAFRGARGEVSGFASTVKGVAAASVSGLKTAAGGLVGVLGGPWGLAIAAGTTLIATLANKSAEAAAEQEAFAAAGKAVADVIREQNGVINEAVRNATAKQAADRGLLDLANQLGISGSQVTSAVLGQGTAYEDLLRVLGQKAQIDDGQLNTQGQLMQGLIQYHNEIGNGTNRTQQVTDATKQWNDQTQQVSTRQAIATTSTDLYKQAIERAGIEFDESAGLADQLKAAIESLTAAEMAQIDTLEGYEAAQDALDEAVKANGATLNIHTEAGRRNRDALEDVAKKSRDLMQADIDSGVPMNQALARHNARIKALREEATKTFGAKSEANKLITAYSKIPKDVRTAIRVQGYEEANRRMLDLSAKQTLLEKGMAITPSNLRAINQEKNRQRSGGFAFGGPVFGPGTSTSDSIVARLSNDEHVWTAEEVDAAGGHKAVGALRGAALKGMLPAFAKGGAVTWPFNVSVKKTKIPDPFAFALAAAGRAGSGGAGVQRWAPLVLQVLRMLGQSAGLLPNVLRRMNQESGGNPNAINLWDSNAQRGYPSQGLMQTIPGTFNAYAGPFRARGITDPLANIYAGVNYAIHRYGSLAYAMDKPGGYKNGGWLKPGQLGYNETSKPEAVFTQEQLSDLKRPEVHKHYHLTMQVANHPVSVRQEFAYMEAMAGL